MTPRRAERVTPARGGPASSLVDARIDALPNLRIDVLAEDAPSVVTGIGGWLCDQSMAGWTVRLLTSPAGDETALRVLGVTTADAETVVDDRYWADPPSMCIVSTPLYVARSTVRDGLHRVLTRGNSEVVLWGATCPPGLTPGPGLETGPSRLAGIFWQHAAAGIGADPPSVPATMFNVRPSSPPRGRF